ncbi:MAG: thioesterase domain-containing protein [Bacteroidota bacterium]
MKISLALIPGLGFTQAVFQNLEWELAEKFGLEWIEPLGNESLDAYAKRMAEPLRAASYPLVLLGHSFGGMMASYMTKLLEVESVGLISSIRGGRIAPKFQINGKVEAA